MDGQAAPAGPATEGGGPPPPGLLQSLRALWSGFPALLGGRFEILALELQRAGLALAQIVALVVVMAILGVTAWLLLWVGIVAALVALGLHLAVALGAALLLNLLAMWLAARRIVALSDLLKLPASRRHLTTFPAARAVRPAAPPSTEPHHAHERHASTDPGPSAASAA